MQHLQYGITGLPWLSYEGVFVHLCAVDAGLCAMPAPSEATCCRLRTSRSVLSDSDAGLAAFAAATGMLLAGVKVDDDVRDSKSLTAKALNALLRRKVERAKAYFRELDPLLEGELGECIDRHLQMERLQPVPPPEEFARPTGDAFARLFATAGRVPGLGARDFADVMRELGHAIGSAIVIRDCALDWRADLRRGHVNPVRDPKSAEETRELALQHLSRALWVARDAWGDSAQSVAVLRHNFDRLARPATVREVPSFSRTLERWGLRREPGYTYAGVCDCACDGAGCEACSILEGCGECGDCACLGCFEGSDFSCACGDCSSSDQSKPAPRTRLGRRKSAPSVTEGEALSDLAPYGVVAFEGLRFPARSAVGQFLVKGSRVEVVEEGESGLFVRPFTAALTGG